MFNQKLLIIYYIIIILFYLSLVYTFYKSFNSTDKLIYKENKTFIIIQCVLTQYIYLSIIFDNFVKLYINYKIYNNFSRENFEVLYFNFSNIVNYNFYIIFCLYILFEFFHNKYIFGCKTKFQCDNIYSSLNVFIILIIGLYHTYSISTLITNVNKLNFITKNIPTEPIECSICLETDCSEFSKFNCGHQFHSKCFEIYSKKRTIVNCPFCNQDTESENTVNLMV